jgi:hypothetical protein
LQTYLLPTLHLMHFPMPHFIFASKRRDYLARREAQRLELHV